MTSELHQARSYTEVTLEGRPGDSLRDIELRGLEKNNGNTSANAVQRVNVDYFRRTALNTKTSKYTNECVLKNDDAFRKVFGFDRLDKLLEQ